MWLFLSLIIMFAAMKTGDNSLYFTAGLFAIADSIVYAGNKIRELSGKKE